MTNSYPPPSPPLPPSSPFGAARKENVGLGLLGALAAVLGGIVLTVILWRIGIIAGICSFAIAAGAAVLYMKAAGAPPKKGLAPLLMLIIVGVFLSFFAGVASDLWDAYGDLGLGGLTGSESRIKFITDNLFRGEILKHYGKDAAFFVVFAVLGIFGTMRRLIASAG